MKIIRESLYAIHFRPPHSDEWRIYRHITGGGPDVALAEYLRLRNGPLANCHSNLMNLRNGGFLAQDEPSTT